MIACCAAALWLAGSAGNAHAEIEAHWLNALTGSWGQTAMWSTNPVFPNNGSPNPGDLYDVYFDATGAAYIVSATQNVTLSSLTLNSPDATIEDYSGKTMEIGVLHVDASRFKIGGGSTLLNTRIETAGDGRVLLQLLHGFSVFDNVTLAGNLTAQSSNDMIIRNGLTLDGGAINVNPLAGMYFQGAGGLNGTGTITFGTGTSNPGYIEPDPDHALVIASGITIQTGTASGVFGGMNPDAQTQQVINNGTIQASAGQQISFNVASFVNQGLTRTNGGTLSIYADWTNLGTIELNGGILELGGQFAWSDLGNIQRTGGEVRITGVFDNSGQTLLLDAQTGSWDLNGGTIVGGTIQATGGAAFIPHYGTLDGVTLDTPTTGAFKITNGLTLLKDLTLTGTLSVADTQTIDGHATIHAQGSNARIDAGGPGFQSLTTGPGIVISVDPGASLLIGSATNNPLAFDNQGTINVEGGTLALSFEQFTNTGTIHLNAGTLNLGRQFTTAALNHFDRMPGTTVNLVGTLDNTGATLNLASLGGAWHLGAGARIAGGSIQTDATNALLIDVLPGGVTTYPVLQDTNLSGPLTLDVNQVLQVEGTLNLEAGSTLSMLSTSSPIAGATIIGAANSVIDGPGEIVFNGSGSSSRIKPGAGTMTFGADLVIRTGATGGAIGANSSPSAPRFIVNNGLISAQTPGTTITISNNLATDLFTNNGIVEAANGASVVIANHWAGAGLLRALGGSLYLGGTFTGADVQNMQNVGGHIVLRQGTLDNTGNTLMLNSTTGSLELGQAGILMGGTVVGADGAGLIAIIDGSSATLQDVQIDAPLTMMREVYVKGHVFFNGAVTMNGFNLRSLDHDVIDGASAINLTGSILSQSNHALTIGSGLTFTDTTKALTVGDSSGIFTNHAAFAADGAAASLEFKGQSFANDGVLSALNGGKIKISATQWSNTGAIHLNGGTLELAGAFSTAGLGAIDNVGGAIILTGTLDNTGATLKPDATIGDLTLNGGTITGGIIDLSMGHLIYAGNTKNKISGSQILGPLDLTTDGAKLTVENGVAFNGIANVTGSGAALNIDVSSLPDDVLIHLGDATGFARTLTLSMADTFTLGADALVRGGNATVNSHGSVDPNGPVINLGEIRADINGQTLILAPRTLRNHGMMNAQTGGILEVYNSTAFTNETDGTMHAAGGTLWIDASNWTNNGLIDAVNGSTFILARTWTNTGSINVADSTLEIRNSSTTPGNITAVDSLIKVTDSATTAFLHQIQSTNVSYSVIGGIVTNTSDVITLDAPWAIGSNGQIKGGVIEDFDGSPMMISAGASASTFDSVTLNGNVVVNPGATLLLTKTISLGANATISLVSTAADGVATLRDGTSTGIVGSGQIVLNGSDDANQITYYNIIGNGVTLRTGTTGGTIANGINAGLVLVETPGATVTLLSSFRNAGVVRVTDGQVVLGAATGPFTSLTGSFIGSYERTGGTISIAAKTISNSGNVIDLDKMGDVSLLSGTQITGGTIRSHNGHELIFTTTGAFFSSVVLDADVRVLAGASGAAPNVAGHRITLEGAADMDATVGLPSTFHGQVFLAGSDNANRIGLTNFPNATINSDTLIETQTTGGVLDMAASPSLGLINLGTLRANVDGSVVTVMSRLLGNYSAFANQGQIEVTNGARIEGVALSTSTQPWFDQTAGALKLDQGTFATPDRARIRGGVVEGRGVIEGDVELKGTGVLRLGVTGGAPGALMIEGDLSITEPTAKVDVVIDGIGGLSEHNRVDVTGDVTLGGMLALSLADGYTPTAGDVFTLLTYGGTRTGRFDEVTGAGLLGDLALLVLYDDDPGGVAGEVVARATMPGDSNADGRVDISDLVVLARNFGAIGTMDWFDGDFNLDGKVDISDLVLLGRNFDLHDPAAAALAIRVDNVPEPGMAMIWLMSGAGVMRRFGRRCRARH
ncbi:MAG: hypothetical protein GC162_14875 [Planctomycetes bacterium]|nr:hypothetical protein [Planctomycetota bacterium]